MTEDKKVFVREATGLVREWSSIDGFFYNILAMTVPLTFALTFSLIPISFSGANINISTLWGIALFLPVTITYAMMAVSMPRSGGDYVFQSRALFAAIGMMNGLAFTFLLDALFEAIDGVLMSSSVLSPFTAVIAGSNLTLSSLASWFASAGGELSIAVIVIIFAFVINATGMRTYARVQRWMFVIGLVGAALTVAVFAFSTHLQFVSSFNTFARSINSSNTNAYNSIVNTASSSGLNVSPAFDLNASLLGAAIIAFGFGGTIWTEMQAGEIKRANKLGLQIFQMTGALVFVGVLLIILNILIDRVVGTSFLTSIGYVFYKVPHAYPLNVPPYFTLFAFILNRDPIVYIFILLWSFLWVLIALSNSPLAGARFMLAAGFDRVLPERFARVSDRFHTPVFSLAVYSIVAGIFAILYTYIPTVGTWTLDVELSVVTFEFFTCLAAVVLPFRNRAVFESSPISKYKLGGLPVISIVGAVGSLAMLWLIIQYATVSALGVNSLPSAIFLIIVYAGSLVTYFVSKLYRKSQGIDLNIAFREIPPE